MDQAPARPKMPPPAAPQNMPIKEKQHVTFQDVRAIFKEYNKTKDEMATLRTNIINGLNSLLQRNTLASEDKAKATTIANNLNAANLAVRISKEGDSANLAILPPELVQQIINMALEGASIQELKSWECFLNCVSSAKV